MTGVKIPAHLQPYIDALGEDLGIEFLLSFGGSYVYLSERPQARSPVVELLGEELSITLARSVGAGSFRVPVGKPFIARHFRAKRWTINAIARKLHVTDVTVRGWLKQADTRQLSLL
ncbi:hypothetical protein [Mycoplana ramosa]|uniref:Helix-turn-helix domain-containing protein n=1 Tax=Mycoplana ramosa TaxID=40837 RepID=A0ABW3Z1X5_MYCRA